LAAEDFVDVDALGGEGLPQHRDAIIWLGGAAHEDVERRVTRLWPGVDRDVALRQHRDPGHAARLKMVQVNVQERRAGSFNAAPQRRLDMIDIIEPFGAVQIDDQMHASAVNTIANGEVVLARKILPAFCRRGSRHFQFGLAVFLTSGTWGAQAFHRSQEGVLAHAVLPNQGPEMPDTGAAASESRSISPREPTNSG
jgi:hypothetical protein